MTSPATSTESPSPPDTLSMLARRRIEAEILGHVYEVLKDSVGRESAMKAVGDTVRRSSIEQARRFAAGVDGATSLKSFVELGALWQKDDALRIVVHEQSDSRYSFDIVRCKYSEMYREMGLGEIGHLLSCQRDGTFCEGYDPRLRLERTQTIMQGASHCDFRYSYDTNDNANASENDARPPAQPDAPS